MGRQKAVGQTAQTGFIISQSILSLEKSLNSLIISFIQRFSRSTKDMDFATLFSSVCSNLQVDQELVLKKAILFFDSLGTDANYYKVESSAPEEHFLRCIDASGKTQKVAQESLYVPMKAVARM